MVYLSVSHLPQSLTCSILPPAKGTHRGLRWPATIPRRTTAPHETGPPPPCLYKTMTRPGFLHIPAEDTWGPWTQTNFQHPVPQYKSNHAEPHRIKSEKHTYFLFLLLCYIPLFGYHFTNPFKNDYKFQWASYFCIWKLYIEIHRIDIAFCSILSTKLKSCYLQLFPSEIPPAFPLQSIFEKSVLISNYLIIANIMSVRWFLTMVLIWLLFKNDCKHTFI